MFVRQLDQFELRLDYWSANAGDDGIDAIIGFVHGGRRGDLAGDDLHAFGFDMVDFIGLGPDSVRRGEDGNSAELVLVCEDGIGNVRSDQACSSEDEDVLGCGSHGDF